MRRLPGLIVVMVMVVFAGDIHAASLLGPAGGMGEQKAGAFSVGAGYFFYDDYWKDGGGMKFQQSQTFGEGAWRPTRDTEIFARLGGTDLKIQELGFKDNYNLYSGIGGRAVFWRPDPGSISAATFTRTALGATSGRWAARRAGPRPRRRSKSPGRSLSRSWGNGRLPCHSCFTAGRSSTTAHRG